MSEANRNLYKVLDRSLPDLSTLLLLQVSLSALMVTVAIAALLKAFSRGWVVYTYTVTERPYRRPGGDS